jgi:hypothetical protein
MDIDSQRTTNYTMLMPPPPTAGPSPSSRAAAFDPALTLDFKSKHFDPLAALYTSGLQPPRPKVRPLDNVGNFRVLLPHDDPHWIDPDRTLHRRSEASYLAAALAKDRAAKFTKQAEDFTKRDPQLGKIVDVSRNRGGPLDILVRNCLVFLCLLDCIANPYFLFPTRSSWYFSITPVTCQTQARPPSVCLSAPLRVGQGVRRQVAGARGDQTRHGGAGRRLRVREGVRPLRQPHPPGRDGVLHGRVLSVGGGGVVAAADSDSWVLF